MVISQICFYRKTGWRRHRTCIRIKTVTRKCTSGRDIWWALCTAGATADCSRSTSNCKRDLTDVQSARWRRNVTADSGAKPCTVLCNRQCNAATDWQHSSLSRCNWHTRHYCLQTINAKGRSSWQKINDDVTRTAGLEKRLILCIDARIMLKRNKDVDAGLVNSSTGTVVGFVKKTGFADQLHQSKVQTFRTVS